MTDHRRELSDGIAWILATPVGPMMDAAMSGTMPKVVGIRKTTNPSSIAAIFQFAMDTRRIGHPAALRCGLLEQPGTRLPRDVPAFARTGIGAVRVRVTAGGQAAQVLIDRTSGSTRLDQAALQAVERWRFVPARRGSESIEAWVLVPIEFELKS